MINNGLKVGLVLMLGMLFSNVKAQKNTLTSGGGAVGPSGSSSYSVGQVVYTTATGTNGSVAQGIQQPYEISIVTGVNKTTIHLEIVVFPNPTTNFLTLKVKDNTALSYQLFDMQGKLIEDKTVMNNATTISLEKQPTATYFLKVVKKGQLIKTFKIIKN